MIHNYDKTKLKIILQEFASSCYTEVQSGYFRNYLNKNLLQIL